MSQPTEPADWWATSITGIQPGVIEHRGIPVQELIGTTSFAEMVWLMVRGERPSTRQAALLEAALVASTDHGPQAPSIAISRMAITCGVGINNAMASAINVLGDVHGGAGEQCLGLLAEIVDRAAPDGDWDAAAEHCVTRFRRHTRHVPGFGHRFHPVDPRRDPLLRLVEDARAHGTVDGLHLEAGLAVERLLARGRARAVPMNIDGATAIIYGELGFPAALARGLFVLSRSVGILAHAWEEAGSGSRLKGPMPPSILPTYRPPADRPGH